MIRERTPKGRQSLHIDGDECRRRLNSGPFWRSTYGLISGVYSGTVKRCRGQAFQVVATSLDTVLQAGI